MTSLAETSLADIVLTTPDGAPKALADFAGTPLIVQTLRYFG